MIATALVLLGLLGALRTGDGIRDGFWPPMWELLARLESMDPRAPEAQRLETQIRHTKVQRRARVPRGVEADLEGFRSRLLGVRLARWKGQDDALLAPDGAPEHYADGEAWLAAAVLVPGTPRARAFAQALAQAANPAALQERQVAAFGAFEQDEERCDVEPARILADAMHARAQATWSAFCVEGIARRSGDYDGADAVLVEHLSLVAIEAVRLDVLQRRGLGALGAGRRELALDLLGQALAAGGADAAQMLGREALAAGERDRAAALFRTLLAPSRDPVAHTPWALRGWGLALLPPPAAPALRDGPSSARRPGAEGRGGNPERPQD